MIEEQYAGKKSEKFWGAVNSIKNEKKHSEMYLLGVLLQDLEGYVLKKLKEVKQ